MNAESTETVTPDTTLTVTTPSDREITLTRVFDAPRRLVFEAWTRTEHVPHWYGCASMKMLVCEIDLRPGGAWRYVLSQPEGGEFGMHGVYREVAAPDRLVYTEVFEAFPDHEALVTMILEEQDGKTKMTATSLYESVEVRDAVIASGMESGAAESLNRLAERVETMK